LRGLLSRLAPGGLLFTSAPALSIPHMEPFHFASFTPMVHLAPCLAEQSHRAYAEHVITCVHFIFALCALQGLATVLEAAGFEVVELGLWGNADYAAKLLKTKQWPAYSDLDKPIENDPMVPCGVWALARRPADEPADL
jgi:hypothetical protein